MTAAIDPPTAVERIDTPIAPLWAEVSARGLHRLSFTSITKGADGDGVVAAGVLDTLREQLDCYFAGEPIEINVPLAPAGTPFQRCVWDALRLIPRGQTWSYRQLATHTGNPDAVRAVGRANGLNPWPILRPCHRVIGSDGSLTGFAGGLDVKRKLLELEGAFSEAPLFR